MTDYPTFADLPDDDDSVDPTFESALSAPDSDDGPWVAEREDGDPEPLDFSGEGWS